MTRIYIRNMRRIFKYLKEYQQHPVENSVTRQILIFETRHALCLEIFNLAHRAKMEEIDIGDRAVEYFVNIFVAAYPGR